jgi:hypothetical protein
LWRFKRFELSVGAWVGVWRDGFFNSQDHTRNNTRDNTPYLITLSAPSHTAGELEMHLKRYNAPLPFSAELTIGSTRLTSLTSAPQAPHLSWSLSAGKSLTLAWWGASEGGAPWALWGASVLTPIQPLSTALLTPSPNSPFGLSALKQALTLAFSDPIAPLNASLSLWSEGLALLALDWSSPCDCWGARLEGGVWHKAWTLNRSTSQGSPETQERRVGLSLRLGP